MCLLAQPPEGLRRNMNIDFHLWNMCFDFRLANTLLVHNKNSYYEVGDRVCESAQRWRLTRCLHGADNLVEQQIPHTSFNYHCD